MGTALGDSSGPWHCGWGVLGLGAAGWVQPIPLHSQATHTAPKGSSRQELCLSCAQRKVLQTTSEAPGSFSSPSWKSGALGSSSVLSEPIDFPLVPQVI